MYVCCWQVHCHLPSIHTLCIIIYVDCYHCYCTSCLSVYSYTQAALAAIVVVALKGLYFQVRDTYKFFKLSWPDMVS